MQRNKPTIDMTGMVFTYWTVMSYSGSGEWLCRCVCGLKRLVPGNRLRRCRTESCGCRYAELKARHAWWDKLTRCSYQKMIARCTQPGHPSFKNYGGRGITVCERWVSDPLAFISDVGRRPSVCHTLDRIDNSGHYEPGNVKWSTWTEQHRNRRNNRILELNGERMCAVEWSERLGFAKSVIDKRLRLGWSHEKTLTTPVRR